MATIAKTVIVIVGVIITLIGLTTTASGYFQQQAAEDWEEWDANHINDYSDEECKYHVSPDASFEEEEQAVREQCGPEFTMENTTTGRDEENPYSGGGESIATGLILTGIGVFATHRGLN